jgi:hypothetical protein
VPLLSGSADSVVTVPETPASVCVNVQVTIILASPISGFEFVSTPEPLHVPARLTGTGGDGSACDPLGCDDAAGDPLGCDDAAAGDAPGCDDAAGDPLGCDDAAVDPLGGDASSGGPLPEEPHEITSTARAVAMNIDRADFMRKRDSTMKYYSQVF